MKNKDKPIKTESVAKEVVSTRIKPDLKSEIEAEALRAERAPAWLYAKLLEIGWEQYQQGATR